MKKSWNTPELTVYGAVEQLTQVTIKNMGTTDALNVSVNLDGSTIPVGS